MPPVFVRSRPSFWPWIAVGALLLALGWALRGPSPVVWEPVPESRVREMVAHEVRVSESAREARRTWPDLTVLGSALLEAVEAREEALRDNEDALLATDDWPEVLASEEAGRLGLARPVWP